MDKIPVLTAFDRAAGEEAKSHSSHVAGGPVTYMHITASVVDPERPFLRGAAAVEGGTSTGQNRPPIVTPSRMGAPVSRSLHMHDFAVSSLATSRPADAEVAAATGWNCSFCLTRREVEGVAKAYTSVLVKAQQQQPRHEEGRSAQDSQQKHTWQQQPALHQQPVQQTHLQPGQQQTIQRRSRQLEQHDDELQREQQDKQGQSAGKQPADSTGEDCRKAVYAGTANCVQNLPTSPTIHPGSSGRSQGRGKSVFPADRAAFSEEATDTARAYVCHLTFHREDGRSPSPRRVPAGFVAHKYAQDLLSREERLIQAAHATAGEYTSSLCRAQTARAQNTKLGVTHSPAQLFSTKDTGHTPVNIFGNQSSTRSGPVCCEADTGLQPLQTQERLQKQQLEDNSTEEAVYVIDAAPHFSTQQQVVAGRATSNENSLATEVGQSSRYDVAVVPDDCAAGAVVTEEDVERARTLASHLDHRNCSTEAVVPVMATVAPNAGQAKITQMANDAEESGSEPRRTESYDHRSCVNAQNLVPDAHRREPASPSAPETASAGKNALDILRFRRNPTKQVDSSVTATHLWLGERERLHRE